MKKTPCYADLDEFWVIGDFVAKAFMGWGGERRQCYIDSGDPLDAERFSTYREAREFMKSDKDAAEWVRQHGGSRFAKPLRCRRSVVVIVDAEKEKWKLNCLFARDSAYTPWIVHSFTDEFRFAMFFTSRRRAQELCDKFTKEKFEFDGNTPLKPGRLRVMEAAPTPVDQGG